MITTWYIYNGVKGILAELDNAKLQGITPVVDDGRLGFYPLGALDGRNIEQSDCYLEYYSTYDDSNVNVEIVCEQVVNIENEQRLIETFVDKTMYEQDLYDREMKTETNRYYDWQSALTKYIDNVLVAWERKKQSLMLRGEDDEKALDLIKNEMEDEWNDVSTTYAAFNHYGDGQTFNNVWSLITERLRNL